MKIKFIAAACIALCSSSVFAAAKTTVDCVVTDSAAKTVGAVTTPARSAALNMAMTCPAETTLFIAGSSALGAALSTVALDLFKTPATVATIVSTTGLNGGNDKGWYGMGLDGKRLYVVYNSNNGSAAGVSQMLAKFDPKADGTKADFIKESKVVSVGPTTISTGVINGTCVETTAATNTVGAVLTCATPAVMQADVAISDVAPQELYALYPAAKAKLTTIKSVPLALQGFGIAVSAKLYKALQDDQGITDLTIQPSVRRADYASLISGSAKTSAVLFNTAPATVLPLNLARRDALSGTQSASNIFFANNSCGNNHDAKGKVIAGVLGGQLPIIGTTATTTSLIVTESATGGGVVAELEKDVYGIGAISLNSPPASGKTWKFVKLDGVSPNSDVDSRAAMAAGNYPFAMTAFAVYQTAPKVDKKSLVTAVITGLQSSTNHNFKGIGYLDGGANYQSMVSRTGGNNCSPLIKGL